MKDSDKKLIVVLSSIIILVILIMVWKHYSRQEQMPIPKPNEIAEPGIKSEINSQESSLETNVNTTTDTATVAQEDSSLSKKSGSQDIKPNKTPFDPEQQPKKFFVMDFNNLNKLPDGYKAENLIITDKGFELPPPNQGEEDKPRNGLLESPSISLDFASNAVSPLWKCEEPEGTTIMVEVSMSPDGQNWGMWHEITIDDDSVGQISQFYPDGSPNPNYGYIPGGVLCWGNRQYLYFRYRISLYSEVKDSPILSGFRLFYQDSTLGEGHVAEINEGQPSPDEQNPKQE